MQQRFFYNLNILLVIILAIVGGFAIWFTENSFILRLWLGLLTLKYLVYLLDKVIQINKE